MIQELEIRDDVRVLVTTGESRSFVSRAAFSYMANLDSARFIHLYKLAIEFLIVLKTADYL